MILDSDINCDFADYYYCKMLQKRYGVNSCHEHGDIVILANQKKLLDITSYIDVSSPTEADQVLQLSCTNIPCSTSQYAEPEDVCPPVTVSPTIPVTVVKTPFKIEVAIGSVDAIALGLLEGDLTYSDSRFKNIDIDVIRAGQELPGKDIGTGTAFYTKPLTSILLTFSHALEDGESLIIKSR